MQGTKTIDGLQYYCDELISSVNKLTKKGAESSGNEDAGLFEDYQDIENRAEYMVSIVNHIRAWASLALEKSFAIKHIEREQNDDLSDDDVLVILEHDLSFWTKTKKKESPDASQLAKHIDAYITQVRIYLFCIDESLIDKDVQNLCDHVKDNIDKVIKYAHQSLEDFNEDPQVLYSFATQEDREVAQEMMQRRLKLLQEHRALKIKKELLSAVDALVQHFVLLDALNHIDINEVRKLALAIIHDQFIPEKESARLFWADNDNDELDDVPLQNYSPALVEVFLRQALKDDQSCKSGEDLLQKHQQDIKELERLLKAHSDNQAVERGKVYTKNLEKLLQREVKNINKSALNDLVLELSKRQYQWQVYKYYTEALEGLLAEFTEGRHQEFIRTIIDRAQKLCYAIGPEFIGKQTPQKSMYSWG